MKTLFSIMSNLQTNYHFKLYFVKVDQDTGGKWLIHGQKPQGQSVASLEPPDQYPSTDSKNVTKESVGPIHYSKTDTEAHRVLRSYRTKSHRPRHFSK